MSGRGIRDFDGILGRFWVFWNGLGLAWCFLVGAGARLGMRNESYTTTTWELALR